MSALKLRRSLLLVMPSSLVLLISIAISATNATDPPGYPDSLVKAVRAFKSSSPTNRYNEAMTVLKELPKCGLKYERDVGTGIMRGYDYARLSYILTSKDVVGLLGKPFTVQTNGDDVFYFYPLNTNTPRSNWLLQIHFRTNRVVRSNLVGGLP